MKTHIKILAASALLAMPGYAENPENKADGTWISVNGTVKSVTSTDTFVLDYGKGMITVEMDDWDNDADAYKVIAGDEVTVNGMIDDDLFETKTIEASSVYVKGLNTYFYASAADEEDSFITLSSPWVISYTVIQGKVTDITGREFTVDTGTRKVTVDTIGMGYDPTDDEGFQKIKKGDRVSVSGQMDTEFFGNRELEASSIVTLSKKK
jgi:hypothetical protein